jgi:hypothetical protein
MNGKIMVMKQSNSKLPVAFYFVTRINGPVNLFLSPDCFHRSPWFYTLEYQMSSNEAKQMKRDTVVILVCAMS